MTPEQRAAILIQHEYLTSQTVKFIVRVMDMLNGHGTLEDHVHSLRSESSAIAQIINDINMTKIRMEELWKLQQNNLTTQSENSGNLEKIMRKRKKLATKRANLQTKPKKKC